MYNAIKKKLLLLTFAVLLAACAVFIYLAFSGYGPRKAPKISPPADKIEEKKVSFNSLQEKKFSWSFDGRPYSITLDLYESAYAYYQSQPKVYIYEKDNLSPNWQEDYFRMFLTPADNDQTFKQAADEIQRAGKANKLSQDQIVELALSFVQSIPYDDARAKAILSATQDSADAETLPKYPYETLYENKGVCSDKSFLALLLIKYLGYGGALLEYPDANHMAVGILCPQEYSMENTELCYGETTTLGHRIGVIPRIDLESRKAVQKEELEYFEENGSDQKNLTLSNPQIYDKIPGNIYNGIIKTFAIQKEMAQIEKNLDLMRNQLTTMKNEVNSLESQLDSMHNKMEKYKDDKDYERYNDLVLDYNNLVKNYGRKIKAYNIKVSDYNSNVRRYNQLIKEYSLTE